MNCPTCIEIPLVMTERSGVEIDYCPTCRGVWLDRGELDKIIERAGSDVAQPRRDTERRDRGEQAPDRDRDWDSDDRSSGKVPKKRKRESFFGELFDF